MKVVVSACLLGLLGLLGLLAVGGNAQAYEPTSHPGMTAMATRSSELHAYLRQAHGLKLGLFEPLKLHPGAIDQRTHRHLTRKLYRMDSAGGYRLDPNHGQRVIGWLMAGSVLSDIPAANNRHHFYSPVLKRGLRNQTPLLGNLLGLSFLFEGGDSVRQFLTGTGFDLTGQSALDWITSADNAQSVTAFFEHLASSISSTESSVRRHHLAMALLAMGSLLHVLQDMASPTHVRDDFKGGHLQQLGRSDFNRGSAYERFVALAYGQFGLPDYTGSPIRVERLLDLFSSPSWTGLADITAINHFSPGTLPRPVQILPDSDPGELHQRLASRLPFSKPALGRFDLACARKGTCHLKENRGPLVAYRVDAQDRLVFFLDWECHAASARHLVPLTVGYSTGLIRHLLRGRLSLSREDNQFVLRNEGVELRSASASVYWEDDKGNRWPFGTVRANLPVKQGDVLGTFARSLSKEARRLIVLVDGKDHLDERIIATAILALGEQTGGSSSP